ncbi:MAG: DUF1572 family protein [Gemmatimonadaceae bacterium]
MFASYLSTIIARDVRTLRREVEAYPDDASLWLTLPTIPNAAGTLVLHLSGNLQYFVGAQLGGNGYVRDREAEFARRDVPRSELLSHVDAALQAVTTTLSRLSDADLDATYPIPFANARVKTADMLIHLATHLTYHLGQIDYHRRAVAGDSRSVNAVSPAEMQSAVSESLGNGA